MNFLEHLRVERFIEDYVTNVSDFTIDDDKDEVIIESNGTANGTAYNKEYYIEIKNFYGDCIPFKISEKSTIRGVQFSNCSLRSLYGTPLELNWVNISKSSIESFFGIPKILNTLRIEDCYISENLEGLEIVRWKPLNNYAENNINLPMLYICNTNIKNLRCLNESYNPFGYAPFSEIRIATNDKIEGELKIDIPAKNYTIESNSNITSIKLNGTPHYIDINRNENLSNIEIASWECIKMASIERNNFTTIDSFEKLFEHRMPFQRHIHLKGNPFTNDEFEKLREIQRKIANTPITSNLSLWIDTEDDRNWIMSDRMLKYSAFRDMLMSEI